MLIFIHALKKYIVRKGVIIMRNKTLYLECFSGISGDMAVASLIDLGVEHDRLLKALDSLHLDGYKVKISRVNKSGHRCLRL